MAFESPSVIRIRNNGEKPYKDQYASTTYVVPPGGENVIPWEAALLWLGDPRLLDDERHGFFARAEELQRVLIRMGSHGLDGRNLSEAERAIEDRPSLEVYDIDNNRIPMLLDDPDGENVVPASFVKGEKDDLFAELDKVKAYQAQLLQLIQENQNQTAAPGLEAAADDSPQRVPGPSDAL